MTGIGNLEEAIARLEQATDAAREATRDAHSAIKALHQAERDALAAHQRIEDDAARAVDTAIKSVIEEAIERLGAQQREAMTAGRDYVRQQFDEYLNICLYGNTQGRGQNLFEELREQALMFQSLIQPRSDLPSLKPKSVRPWTKGDD